MKDLIDYWRNEWKQVTDLSPLDPAGTGSGDLLDYWRNEWRQATDMSWIDQTGTSEKKPNGYYTTGGEWLGSDNESDDKAYTATSKNPDGTFQNVKELPISNSELLDRATWVHGECAGSGTFITDRTVDVDDGSQTSNARVVDYYAGTIQNGAEVYNGFYKYAKETMRNQIGGVTQRTYEGYFTGGGLSTNEMRKEFAGARGKGMPALMKLNNAQNSISAVIKSVSAGYSNPAGRAMMWSGGKSNTTKIQSINGKPATFQFHFSSANNSKFHTFYTIR